MGAWTNVKALGGEVTFTMGAWTNVKVLGGGGDFYSGRMNKCEGAEFIHEK